MFSAIERDYNTYTRETNISPDEIKKASTIIALQRLTSLDPYQSVYQDRYQELNLFAFDKHGTIEVRRFAGTTEEGHIYSLLSMIHAMAREARLTANAIFREKKLENKENKSDKNKKTFVSDSTILLFRAKKMTEQKIELAELRVNPLLEYDLQVVEDIDEIKESKRVSPYPYRLGTAYISLDKQNMIQYKTINREGIEKGRGLITCFGLSNKLSLSTLTVREKNQILHEIAQRGHAKISHLVDKTKTFSHEIPSKLMRGFNKK